MNAELNRAAYQCYMGYSYGVPLFKQKPLSLLGPRLLYVFDGYKQLGNFCVNLDEQDMNRTWVCI